MPDEIFYERGDFTLKEKTNYTEQFAEYLNRISTDYAYPYIDLYIKDDKVLGILISKSQRLIEKFMEIELDSEL